jgi:hypothetical protein
MQSWNPGAYRPAVVLSPTMRRQAPVAVLGQRFDELLSWGPVAGDILRLGAHTLAAYLGYYVWMTSPKKSFPRYLGLAMGVIQTFGAICDGISLGQRAAGTHPPEPACPPGIPIGK